MKNLIYIVFLAFFILPSSKIAAVVHGNDSSDPVPYEFKKHDVRFGKSNKPRWMPSTGPIWDSTSIHPLRDLSMLLGGACDDLEKRHSDGVPLDNVLLHDAVCDLKDQIPTPYKDQFKVFDVGFYTLAQQPYIDQPDIRESLWKKQVDLLAVKYSSHPYNLLIAKQFKTNGKYADFRIGLKLPRATSGFFEKMNNVVEESMKTLILKAIEEEYGQSGNVMAAETKGVEKLKELLGKIVELGTISEEALKSVGFEEAESLTGKVHITYNPASKLLQGNMYDYSGLKDVDNNNTLMRETITDQIITPNGYTNVTLITSNDVVDSGDFNNALNLFRTISTSKCFITWIHYFEKNGVKKIFIKHRSTLTMQENEDFLNEHATSARKNLKKQYGGTFLNSYSRSACDLNLDWRAINCIYDNSSFMSYVTSLASSLNTSYSQGLSIFLRSMLCGMVDQVLDYALMIFDLIDAGIKVVETAIASQWYKRAFKNVAVFFALSGVSSGLAFSWASADALQFFNDKINKIIQFIDKISQVNFDELFKVMFNKAVAIIGEFKDFGEFGTITPAIESTIKAVGKQTGEMLIESIGAMLTLGSSTVIKQSMKAVDFFKNKVQSMSFLDSLVDADKFKKFIDTAFGQPYNKARQLYCKYISGKCFAAGTMVLMANTATPIEQIQLGDLAVANVKVNNDYQAFNDNGKTSYRLCADANEEDWLTSDDQRKIDKSSTDAEWFTLKLELPKIDGTKTKIQLLRPKWWVNANRIEKIGAGVFLAMPEMGVQGYATLVGLSHYRNTKILANGEADDDPNYQHSPVTGIFEHQASDLYRLTLSNQDTIGVTGEHPFYSLDRHGFVNAKELHPGEQLLAKGGSVHVAGIEHVLESQPVYNLEVREWHNFLVGGSGVVVHNSCLFGEIVEQATNWFKYKNFKGKTLKIDKQNASGIAKAIKTVDDLPDIQSNAGKKLEAKVAKAIQQKKELKGYAVKVQRESGTPAGDMDILTEHELIEVKKSVNDITQTSQFSKYLNIEDDDFLNHAGKKVILFIEDAASNPNHPKLKAIQSMGNAQGIQIEIIIGSLDDLKNTLQ
ncbi:MAG: polymorphic toxin-type HINT domain-containing protein [Saprospiraceae bacterium]